MIESPVSSEFMKMHDQRPAFERRYLKKIRRGQSEIARDRGPRFAQSRPLESPHIPDYRAGAVSRQLAQAGLRKLDLDG